MKQKEIKAIAEIIKSRNNQFIGLCNHKIHMLKLLTNDLADYFEKEDRNRMIEKKKKDGIGYNFRDMFDRKQFKDWCGVE